MDQFVTVTVPRGPEGEQEIVNLRHVKKICRDSDYVSTLVFTDGERLDVFTGSLKQAAPWLFAQPLTAEQRAELVRAVQAKCPPPAKRPATFEDLPRAELPEPPASMYGENLGG